MSKLSRRKAVFTYVEDPDPSHGPAVNFRLFYGPQGTTFEGADPDAPADPVKFIDLGLLPDEDGAGTRSFVINNQAALMALPDGTYAATVAANDAAGNWTNFASAVPFPLDLTAPVNSPTNLHIVPA